MENVDKIRKLKAEIEEKEKEVKKKLEAQPNLHAQWILNLINPSKNIKKFLIFIFKKKKIIKIIKLN
jgi:hypothetical protein